MIVTFRDQTNRLIRISQEEIVYIRSSEVDIPDQSETMGEKLNQDRSMKEHMYPTRESQPSCIVLPADVGQFELKASTINMLPVFRGVDAENPYNHASTSTCNDTPRDHVNAVTTLRSGKVVENNVGVPQSVEPKSDSPVHTTPQKTPVVENEYEHDSDSKNSTDVNVPAPSHVPVAPFPQRLVSSIIQNKTPPKCKDPGSPTITCTIGDHTIDMALLDLGASVNLMPYSVYKQLGLGELKPTHVTLQLADRSVKIPRGIVEDVLIKVEIFYFPVHFIVLDTQPVQYPDNHIPVILGRPFLATSNAIINCCNGVLNLSFGNMTVELNVFNISQQPMDCDDSIA
ncbi:uncharacterized protein LOC113316191 [Papaver somniferum]|uniref:uncharacterized protein LOC113316191 n=1 Tax=Papaver somniferum TaxID=3469 RepID=UPI000E6F63FA|nr:uncharacterized protein LOC113316191 [Papaver somniferum]